jgi:cellulose synthase/poly-beta-1,6-N-acetylglucosamine synthase-like glycosyltransferase
MKQWVDTFILVYFFVLNSFYLFLLLLSVFEIARRKSERLPEMDDALLEYGTVPPISIIVPAYNEAENIVDSVKSLLELEYPDHRVIVVNDGSDDETFARLRDAFELVSVDRVVRQEIETEPVEGLYQSEAHERLMILDKVNGGKGDALNAGINAARTPRNRSTHSSSSPLGARNRREHTSISGLLPGATYGRRLQRLENVVPPLNGYHALVCCIDADTIVDRRALLRMIEPYVYAPEEIVAVGGTVRIANGCKIANGRVEEMDLPDSWLVRFQIVEYLRAFLFGRMGMNRLGGNIIISGAFGLFSKEDIVEVGGYDDETVGEDMELVVRLHRDGQRAEPTRRVVQIPEPICYTRAPEDIRTLGVQRDRWHRGLADSLWRHTSIIGNPR